MDGTVLIADDDRTIRMVLTKALTRAGCRVHATGSLAQLARWVEESRPDLVITDVVMPDGNGIDLIPALHRARPDLPVIVISAQNTIVTAVRAQAADAFDYLPKPFDLPELMARARAALERRARTRTAAAPAAAGAGRPALLPGDVTAAPTEGPVTGTDPALPLVGHAPAMQSLFRLVARLLEADLPVLITGEAGSGRTTLARSLHELSARRERGLVTLSPADVGETAFSRARAAGSTGGTLLIEDPAGFDAGGQARIAALLEALGDMPEPPRVLATTDPQPLTALASGRLRPDLYWRLSGATLAIPPLRERMDDIPDLARHLLARATSHGLPTRGLEDEAATALRRHHFPGNVRELENMMLRLALTARGPEITLAEVEAALREDAIAAGPPVSPPPALPLADAQLGRAPAAVHAAPAQPAAANLSAPGPVAAASAAPGNGPAAAGASITRLSDAVEAQLRRYFDLHGGELPPPGLYDRVLAEIERPLIELTLEATGGNQLRAADLLGINRNTLRKKVTGLNIGVTRRRRLM